MKQKNGPFIFKRPFSAVKKMKWCIDEKNSKENNFLKNLLR